MESIKETNERRHQVASTFLKIALPLLLGGGILYWMYRGFDFRGIERVAFGGGMDWTWMILSLPFGMLAQAFRGWRWKLALDPIGEKTRNSVSVYSIFISYALSLVIPRSGEFARCGVLKRFDDVSFAKALGTVVTERAVDTLLIAIITAITFLSQLKLIDSFFARTGNRMESILHAFTPTGWAVTLTCAVAAIVLIIIVLKQISIYERVASTLKGLWQGVISLKYVNHPWLYLVYSLAIWVCYFLHFYLTFFCFGFMKNQGIVCALLCFLVGNIAVLVPTPNGAGPWHFAVKTMLVLYGITTASALYFVLIVHTVQTLFVVLLGIYGWLALSFVQVRRKEKGLQSTIH